MPCREKGVELTGAIEHQLHQHHAMWRKDQGHPHPEQGFPKMPQGPAHGAHYMQPTGRTPLLLGEESQGNARQAQASLPVSDLSPRAMPLELPAASHIDAAAGARGRHSCQKNQPSRHADVPEVIALQCILTYKKADKLSNIQIFVSQVIVIIHIQFSDIHYSSYCYSNINSLSAFLYVTTHCRAITSGTST